jgi:hypothetical protein
MPRMMRLKRLWTRRACSRCCIVPHVHQHHVQVLLSVTCVLHSSGHRTIRILQRASQFPVVVLVRTPRRCFLLLFPPPTTSQSSYHRRAGTACACFLFSSPPTVTTPISKNHKKLAASPKWASAFDDRTSMLPPGAIIMPTTCSLQNFAFAPHTAASRHVPSRHVTSRPVTSRHVPSRPVTSRHVPSRPVTSRHVTSRLLCRLHLVEQRSHGRAVGKLAPHRWPRAAGVCVVKQSQNPAFRNIPARGQGW